MGEMLKRQRVKDQVRVEIAVEFFLTKTMEAKGLIAVC